MQLITAPYVEQLSSLPQTGRHITAQFDDATIVVYQAYCPQIGDFAIQHGYFGDGFSYGRMSWIKPSFRWMMYRSDWGRAIQLGLRESVFRAYGRRKIVEIIDMREFVAEQRKNIDAWKDNLIAPIEKVYLPPDPVLSERLGLGSVPDSRPDGLPRSRVEIR